MQNIEPRITKSVFNVLSVQNSVSSRSSLGGTAPEQVMKQVLRWKKILNEEII